MSQEKYRSFPVSSEALRPWAPESICPQVETGEHECGFSIVYGASRLSSATRPHRRAEELKHSRGAVRLFDLTTARASLFDRAQTV